MKRFLFPLSLCVLVAMNAQAAGDDLSRDVTVEREYTSSGIEADKLYTVPEKETFTPDKPVVSYSTWSQAHPVTATPGKIRSNTYRTSNETDARNGIFRAGLGFYWQTLAEFYYPLLQGDTYLLDINVAHHSDWGKIKFDLPGEDSTKHRAARHNTDVDLTFEKQFKDCRLASKVDFSYNGFDYYGYSTDTTSMLKDSLGTFLTAGLAFNLYSTNAKKSVQYSALLDYHYFGRNFGGHTNHILGGIDLYGEAGNGFAGAEVLFDANLHGGSLFTTKYNSCLFTLNPYYKYVGRNWDLRIGGKLFANVGDSLYNRFPISGGADIQGQFGLVPEVFYLYAGIGSDFKTNAYQDILRENYYIDPELIMQPSYTPVDLHLGMKIKIMDGFLFEVGAGYEHIMNEHYYINSYDAASKLYANVFDVVYNRGTNHIGVNAGLHFDKIKGLNLDFTANYNYWGVTADPNDPDNLLYKCAWQRPSWEIVFDGSYIIKERWKVGLSYKFLGGRKALTYAEDGTMTSTKMRNVHDLNIYASYQALKWLNVFVTGKNLINNKADSYYGYRNFGINGMAGVTISF